MGRVLGEDELVETVGVCFLYIFKTGINRYHMQGPRSYSVVISHRWCFIFLAFVSHPISTQWLRSGGDKCIQGCKALSYFGIGPTPCQDEANEDEKIKAQMTLLDGLFDRIG